MLTLMYRAKSDGVLQARAFHDTGTLNMVLEHLAGELTTLVELGTTMMALKPGEFVVLEARDLKDRVQSRRYYVPDGAR